VELVNDAFVVVDAFVVNDGDGSPEDRSIKRWKLSVVAIGNNQSPSLGV